MLFFQPLLRPSGPLTVPRIDTCEVTCITSTG
jgi:hypothetical protein